MSQFILGRASHSLGIPVEQIIGRTRTPDICMVRFAIMDAMRAEGLSLPKIARRMQRRHTTVMHGLRQAAALRGRPAFDSIRSAIA